MAMPHFQEFMASLDSETVSGIMRDANKAMKIAAEQDVHRENVPGLQLLSASYQISLELLAVYHKWLEQHL